MDSVSSAGLRKRQQIKVANRVMFLWVAGASVVVGVAVVLTIFLVQNIWYEEKVITEKNKTVKVLEDNIKEVEKLKNSINVLNTNQALIDTKLQDDDTAIQSVLDALPANANSTSLASSLQTRLLTGVQGVTIEAISVDPVAGLETIDVASDPSTAGAPVTDSNVINYSFSVSANTGNYGALRQDLERIEKSIRPFNNTSVTIETQGSDVVMTVKGSSYYEPARTIELKSKVIKP